MGPCVHRHVFGANKQLGRCAIEADWRPAVAESNASIVLAGRAILNGADRFGNGNHAIGDCVLREFDGKRLPQEWLEQVPQPKYAATRGPHVQVHHRRLRQ